MACTLFLLIVLPPRRGSKAKSSDCQLFKEAVAQWEAETATNKTATKRLYSYSSDGNPTEHSSFRQYESKRENALIIELNSADTSDLQLLRGIGPVFANRIAKYRSLLGGFTNKEQLMEVYGMDDERYNMIAGLITVDQSLVDKIDINNATLNDIKRHPYLDYYQAKAIVNYRQRGNRIENIEDLLKINLIDSTTAKKIQNYIQFN